MRADRAGRPVDRPAPVPGPAEYLTGRAFGNVFAKGVTGSGYKYLAAWSVPSRG